jgi:Meiotically up-regulated gene 113
MKEYHAVHLTAIISKCYHIVKMSNEEGSKFSYTGDKDVSFQAIRRDEPWFICKFLEFEKDGQTYILPCDGVHGEQPYPIRVIESLITELRRSVLHLSDAEIAEYNAAYILNIEIQWRQSSSVKPQSRRGFVYILQCEDTYKIGYTDNPRKRLRALSVKSPFPMYVRLLIPSNDMIGLEATLHQRFEKQWQRGEWFHLSPSDLEALRQDYPTSDATGMSVD